MDTSIVFVFFIFILVSLRKQWVRGLTAMKKASSLNPYASSYIPISKRIAADEHNDSDLVKGLKSGNKSVPLEYQLNSADAFRTSEVSKWKDHHHGELYASSSHYPNEMSEKLNANDDNDMDLAYLQMSFPELSEESISDVYMANRYDLDASFDMLDHLELSLVDKLPDTLDIGDVSEPISSKDFSQKLKSIISETEVSKPLS